MKSFIILEDVELTFKKNLKNSPYGNPRLQLTFYDGKTDTEYDCFTATDSSCGYILDTSRIGNHYDLKGHYTRKGTLIINYVLRDYLR